MLFGKPKKKILILSGVALFVITVAVFFFFSRPERIVLDQEYGHCITDHGNRSEIGTCLQKLAVRVSRAQDSSAIETTISALTDIKQKMWCHEFMHYVGWEALKKSGNIFDAFTDASGICDSGMYHGIVEEYILEKEGGGNLDYFTNSVIPHACVDDERNRRLSDGVISTCHHGLGHAFMFITNNDLVQSLQYCDLVGEQFARSCYTGALMENIASKEVGRFGAHPGRRFAYRADEPDYPCNVLEEQYREYCYQYKGASGTNGGDYRQAFRECLRVDPVFQESCFRGIGTNVPGPHMTTREASETCKFALDVDQRAYQPCIEGAMSFLVQLHLGAPQPAVEFCDNVVSAYKDACATAAGKMFGYWSLSREEFVKKCDAFEQGRRRDECLSSRTF